MSDDVGNGSAPETDEERRWREHEERFDAVQALERRLGTLESAMRAGFTLLDAKLDRLLQQSENQRDDIPELYRRWVKHDERIASLETKPVRGRKAKK